ncbi:Cholesterol 24-hydroxylase [Holothuria leucospilota]|uniref:Cholesterol 24-hydroxylase n=1 Tax=Holothuria leucospilota TaxID=206669 RepID=A0A9Q1CI29_HOLLE|nr:Cholesterol 24-hydroxylase [Holothuria leucospilota]
MLFLILLKYALVLTILAVVTACLGFIAYLHYIHQKFQHIPGPKRTSFIFGNYDIQKALTEERTTMSEILTDLHSEYGPVVVIYLLHMTFVSCTDPKTVKEILLDNKYLKPSFNYEPFRQLFGERFMGKGLVSETNHEKWGIHRHILNPAFHRKYLMELITTFGESADRLVKYLSVKADGKTEVKVMDALERATLDVICKVGFSMEGDMIANDTPFANAIHISLHAMRDTMSPSARFDPRKKARDYRRDVKNAVKLLRGTGLQIITQRLQDLKEGKELPKDILSFVIDAAVVKGNFTMEEMIDEFVTLFVGGQETTSTVLSFALICLGQNPHEMDKVREEVDRVIGDKKVIEYEDIMKLEYMTLVLKETLRLFPPVLGTVRVVPEDMTVVGIKIPAGTALGVLSYTMGRMDEFFKDPLTFNPDRFNQQEDRPLYAYFPFSLGARSCIGQQFAMSYLLFGAKVTFSSHSSSFIFGNSDIQKELTEGRTTFAEVLTELHSEYGPVVVIYMLHMTFITCTDPKTVKDILLDNKYLKPRLSYEPFRQLFGERFMGKGLVSEINHEKWGIHRRILNPAFHRKYLMELTATFGESADRLVKYLSVKADGKTEVKVMDALERATLDVICKVGFSMEGDMVENDTPFANAIHVSLHAMRHTLSPWARFDPRKKARDYRRDVKDAVRLLRDTGFQIITQRLQDLKEGKELPKDILRQETTSTLLSFALICLGQNPHEMDKVRGEVDRIIGDKEIIEYEDIMKLEYMTLVLKETLRLFPPVLGATREVPEDMTVVGVKIPAGATLGVSWTNGNPNYMVLTYTMGRMDEFFKDPLTFNPDRFNHQEDRPLYAYFPFSMGARSCIGQQFAMIEARMLLSKILQKLNLRLVPEQDFGIYEELVIKPKGHCANYITIRRK